MSCISTHEHNRNPSSAEFSNLDSLPIVDAEGLVEAVKEQIKKTKITDKQVEVLAPAVVKYISFLRIKPEDKSFQKTISRLAESSTQFLLCDDFEDWQCLEQDPILSPLASYRIAAREGLGKPVRINEDLNVEYYFTFGWLNPLGKDPADSFSLFTPGEYIKLSERLGAVLAKDWKKISMALYGIDDINDKMSPVYRALTSKKPDTMWGVFDSEGYSKTLFAKDKTPKKEYFPIVFSYVAPKPKEDWGRRWMFSQSPKFEVTNPKFQTKTRTNIDLQYTGTADLINFMNQNITSDEQAMARLEWPNEDTEIMHNKFFVLEGDGKVLPKAAVWTGTANVARTDMEEDTEPEKKSNSNMALLIKNESIANVFLEEFNEMFSWSNRAYQTKPEELVNAKGLAQIPVATFHKNKKPNTKRYFQYNDDNEVRVHFSPTDDAEHRVLIPMLLSAQKGDVIRVSMFGGGGIEFVRAFQWAQAKGADVKIVFDALTGGCGFFTWVTSSEANLIESNPYLSSSSRLGSLEVLINAWSGMNHMKVATLTRDEKNQKPHVEVIVVGSQNWTRPGNDENDENEITIRNLKKDVVMGKDFNKYFDLLLMPNAMSWSEFQKNIAPQRCKGQGGH